jgi:hypothetical protein
MQAIDSKETSVMAISRTGMNNPKQQNMKPRWDELNLTDEYQPDKSKFINLLQPNWSTCKNGEEEDELSMNNKQRIISDMTSKQAKVWPMIFTLYNCQQLSHMKILSVTPNVASVAGFKCWLPIRKSWVNRSNCVPLRAGYV